MKIQEFLAVVALIFVVVLAIMMVDQAENDNLNVPKHAFLINPKSEKDFSNLKVDKKYLYFGSAPLEAGSLKAESSTLPVPESSTKPMRYSETNVQVKGIDESDLVKTDGKNLYLSTLGKTYSISAYPPENLKILNELNETGNLYLYKNKLILIKYNKLKIYDKNTLKLLKEIDLNGSYVDSRLKDNKLILVVRKNSLVVKPFVWNGIKIDYSRYYIPIYPINYPITYIVSEIDLDKEKPIDSLALVGSYQQTLYVSKNNIYFAYEFEETEDKIVCGFLEENENLFRNKIDIEKVKRICENKDFSSEAKMLELEKISYNLNAQTNETFIAKLKDALEKYIEKHINELQTTGIAKINYENGLKLVAQVKVPGKLLNQFSMDEYNGYLRIATSIRDWRYRDYMVNNLYIIKDSEIVGKIENFEKGERIYAVRFLGNKAYVVTYRETDPLFVVDLSDPKNPKIIGKLKIPGYSTYLHPISDDLMIGIGKDSSKVKVSLFDVSDMENPKELDKFVLDEYWSPSLSNHHAFLYDNETKKLIVPAGTKFYIFKVKNNKIDLLFVDKFKCNTLRALYFDNYIYDISRNEIHVVNETKVIKTLKLSDRCYYYPPYPPIYKAL